MSRDPGMTTVTEGSTTYMESSTTSTESFHSFYKKSQIDGFCDASCKNYVVNVGFHHTIYKIAMGGPWAMLKTPFPAQENPENVIPTSKGNI